MKYKATKKFAELDSTNNYQGLGKEVFQQLERGESIEIPSPEELLKDKYVEQSKLKIKEES
tara:strand:- start:1273 stop:1455 length:183 start_codon:yes stop_codon:yes gene_type:complete